MIRTLALSVLLPAAPAVVPVSGPQIAPSALAPASLSAAVKDEAPRLMLTTAVPVLPALPAIPALASPSGLVAARPSAPAAGAKSLDESAAEAKALFDGGRAGEPGEGWTLGAIAGDGGAPVHYKSRPGNGNAPARVYAGGLALNESFEPLFARPEKPAGAELFVWTRGHAPSGWQATQNPIDADARDLAAAVNLAAKSSPGGKVELALHSFGTLVFQRMIQLREEPAVKAALDALKGSRVFMLHATTHYEGSERRAGRDFERMGQATRAVVDWLDAGDAMAAWWGAAAQPWHFMRAQVVAAAAKEAAAMMKKDLSEPWDKAVDHIRKAFLKDLERDARDPGWQEAMLRRSSDMFRLEFSLEDAARIKELGIRLELVHSDGDALLNWESALALFERLGIDAPAEAPKPGTILVDKTGRFRARIVSGDHYWPLKKRDELAALLR